MTAEFFRHLYPDKTLVIDLGERGRGTARPDRYKVAQGRTVTWNKGMDHELPEHVVHEFCTGLDVIYSAETFYRHDFCAIARAAGARTVLHVMPELFRADMTQPDAYWAPTDWELDRLPPETIVVPTPVALDHLYYARRPWQREQQGRLHFVHLAAPAFHDRNGTDIVIDALRYVRRPCRVTFRGPHGPQFIRNPAVEATWDPTPAGDYWQQYDPEYDVLLLPRRYAGSSLTMQEAAGAGLPIITLDLEPQRQWVHEAGRVPAVAKYEVQMVGGKFAVHTARRLADVAEAMDRLSDNQQLVTEMSDAARRYAEQISWDNWAPRYKRLLEDVAAR